MHISWQMIAIPNVTTMKGRKKPVGRAGGRVGDHAGAVVLAEHREDAGAHEEPQQVPATATEPCEVHA
jgi:hypothetical protein